MCEHCKRNQLLPEYEMILHGEYEDELYNELEYELLPEFEFGLLPEVGSASRSSPAYIKWVQATLNQVLGLYLVVDGISGPKTRSAIRSFQQQKGLVVDGIVGPITERALIAASGSTPSGSTPLPVVPVTPGTNWSAVPRDQRILYVMERLVNQYGMPVNGASGLVGNLLNESSLIPNRVEGSQSATPMRSQNFRGQQTDFSATEIMNRNAQAGIGPRLPGIGLAQWTSPNRRTGLFQYQYQGQQLGEAILFNMDAQIDYLIFELQNNYRGVYATLMSPGVTVNDASDDVVYRFEVPASVLSSGSPRRLLPRNDPQVQTEFARRRQSSHLALQVYRTAHP